jgi:tripartite-type tricarboxylate transporter receptor subunit TctC
LPEGRDGVVLDFAAAQVRDNRVRGIFITLMARFTKFPDIPTLAEYGSTWRLGKCD